MKKFLIGFLVGFGAMYWYLEHGAQLFTSGETWMEHSASAYHHDKVHGAAQDALGEKGKGK